MISLSRRLFARGSLRTTSLAWRRSVSTSTSTSTTIEDTRGGGNEPRSSVVVGTSAWSRSQSATRELDEEEQLTVPNWLAVNKYFTEQRGDAVYMNEVDELWAPPGSPSVFGGQVVGQALVAAQKETPVQKGLHSMHSYFLRPGSSKLPIFYTVTKQMDSKRFSNRQVTAWQMGDEKERTVILSLIASFCLDERDDPDAVEHSTRMPNVPGPEDCLSEAQMVHQLIADKRVPERMRPLLQQRLDNPVPIDTRFVDLPVDWFNPQSLHPSHRIWLRALPGGDGDEGGATALSQHAHNIMAAYLSDWSLATTCLRAHAVPFPSFRFKRFASIDHSVRFHGEPFRSDEWLLLDAECTRMGSNRAFCSGEIYTAEGVRVMSVSQEALLRLNPAES